ncbi:MAG: hypothetical protein LWW86_09590 [Micrococcales bacterium]|nr:hypothetical protein [Micrococcales bacterium]
MLTAAERASLSATAVLAAGVAAATWGSSAVRQSGPVAIVATVVGLVAVALRLHRALPSGAVRLSRGIPATIAVRGLVALAFILIGTYLPLLLTEVRDAGPTLAGVSLAVTGGFWAVGSNLASRDAVRRRLVPAQLVRLAMLVMAVGAAGPALLATGHIGIATGMSGWALCATGMGIVSNALATHLVEITADGEQCRVNASARISEAVGAVIAVAGGGAVIAARADHLTGMPFAAISVTGALLAGATAVAAHRVAP